MQHGVAHQKKIVFIGALYYVFARQVTAYPITMHSVFSKFLETTCRMSAPSKQMLDSECPLVYFVSINRNIQWTQ
jgi:hypothetical protein